MSDSSSSHKNELDLNRLAEEELIREAKQAVARSEVSGIDGFKKCPLPRTNKIFLTNTIVNNIKSNKIRESQKEMRKYLPYASSSGLYIKNELSHKCYKSEKHLNYTKHFNR